MSTLTKGEQQALRNFNGETGFPLPVNLSLAYDNLLSVGFIKYQLDNLVLTTEGKIYLSKRSKAL